MIDQINAILQKKLAGTPLEQKGIRLQESLTGALWIYVGLKRYDGIEAVPEKEILILDGAMGTELQRRGAEPVSRSGPPVP